ncbi:hypothetical protein ACIQ6K_37660 [Streptomyces sp. NPDC096354]|uniref:hypothetical protein n=1 Tax=Streptomyces sp. NPDC096354 TaxID=3366088 RepID=UPI0037FE9659
MPKYAKQAQKRQPQAAGRRIVQVTKTLGKWAVQGAASGAVREVIRYALDLWTQL